MSVLVSQLCPCSISHSSCVLGLRLGASFFYCDSLASHVQCASSCLVNFFPCPSYVPFVFRFPSSPSCVFRSAVIHSLSGCLLCSHHVSMFPSIHASFSCLRLSHLFSQFLSLCLVLCRIVFPSPQFFILYQPNRLLAFCLECLPICVCPWVHYFALYTVCRP